MNYVRLLWLFFRLGALNEMAYRINFFVQIIQTGIRLATALAGLAVIFSYTETLGGWNPNELLALVGIYFLVGGIMSLVIQPSMHRLMESIRLGTLDFTLTKPEDSQLLVSAQHVEIWKVIDIAVGLIVLGTGLLRLGAAIGPAQAAAFGATLLCGTAIVYSMLLILSTFSFWLIKVDNILEIFHSMYEAGRWPVGIYPQWLRVTLTLLVPVAFAITVPAQALVGRLTGQTLLGTVALAATLLTVSRWFWHYGVKHYSGASA